MADVFISYAKEDTSYAGKLARLLEAEGFTVWWDWKIVGGGNFRAAIRRELLAAKKVIVLWSKYSVPSDYVFGEADLARKKGKLVPLVIDNLKVPDDLPLGHHTIQSVRVRKLERDITRIVAALNDVAPPPRRTFSDRVLDPLRTGRYGIIAGLIVILAILPLGYFALQKNRFGGLMLWEYLGYEYLGVWDLDDSILYLVPDFRTAERDLFYLEPGADASRQGARPDDRFFIGRVVYKPDPPNEFVGTAFLVSRTCRNVGFPVRGNVQHTPLQIILTGERPTVDENCQTVSAEPETYVLKYRNERRWLRVD